MCGRREHKSSLVTRASISDKPCSACYADCKRDTAHICCCGTVAVGRPAPPPSIGISCPLGAQQQTRRTPLLRSIDGTDRQTDGRMDTRPLHRPCSLHRMCHVTSTRVLLYFSTNINEYSLTVHGLTDHLPDRYIDLAPHTMQTVSITRV